MLDWELCALGDVLIDVGGLLANWDEPEDPWPDVWMQAAPTRVGRLSRQSTNSSHATPSRPASTCGDLDYYRAFNYWRIAVIAEGMKRRYQSGALAANGVRAEDIGQRVIDRARMAEMCLDLADALTRRAAQRRLIVRTGSAFPCHRYAARPGCG